MIGRHLIDMSAVPVPDVVTEPNFESLFEDLKALLLSYGPEYEAALRLESDPLVKLLQVMAYRELVYISRINDAARAVMLATATGNDLEAIASRYNIERLVIVEEDAEAKPPQPAVMESDEALRRRTQMAFDGLSTAGSIDSYIYHTLTSDGRVKDAAAYSPAPTEIVLTVLSHEGTGTASTNLIEQVRTHFGLTKDGLSQDATPSRVRPQGDRLTINSANVVTYNVKATILTQAGPAQSAVLHAAEIELEQYIAAQHALGMDVTLSGIYRALHRPGAQNVIIEQPAADVVCDAQSAPYCSNIDLSVEVGGEA